MEQDGVPGYKSSVDKDPHPAKPKQKYRTGDKVQMRIIVKENGDEYKDSCPFVIHGCELDANVNRWQYQLRKEHDLVVDTTPYKDDKGREWFSEGQIQWQ